MKDETVNLRVGGEDKETLKQASENLSKLTNEKVSVSKTIRESLKLMAEQDPNKPELFYVNRLALRDLEANLDYGKNHLQKIIDEYKALTNGTIPEMKEIETWFGTGRYLLIADKTVIEESIFLILQKALEKKHPGLEINVKMPDTTELINLCRQLIYIPDVQFKSVMYWDAYMIKSGKVELNPSEVEVIKTAYRLYAEQPEEKARLTEVRKVCAVLDNIKLQNPADLNIKGFCYYDAEAGVFAPSEGYIKGYLR